MMKNLITGWARWRRRAGLAALAMLAIIAFGVAVPRAVSAAEVPGLAGKRFVIDAGHGGRDGGAQSANGIQEKTITLGVAQELAHLLRQAGATVYLTRNHDTSLTTDRDRGHHQQSSLKARTVYAKSKHPDAFVSIHCNGAPSPNWRGAHVIYLRGNEQGHDLAAGMQQAFRQLLLPTRRSIDDTTTLYLLKRIKGPAVLAEIGFVTNPEEAAALKTKAYQRRVAFAIYASLMAYFGAPESAERHTVRPAT